MLPVYVYVRIEMIPPRGSPVIPDNCYNHQVWITCGAAWTAAPRRRRERKRSIILKARFDSAQRSTYFGHYIRATCLWNGKAGHALRGARKLSVGKGKCRSQKPDFSSKQKFIRLRMRLNSFLGDGDHVNTALTSFTQNV